jgi:two-component system chemotaxis response regulator CheB
VTVAPPPAEAEPVGVAPLTVVIVDDSAVQRRFARSAIEADGRLTVVGEARNGRDAVALVDRLRPQAVLMDLHLPVMNGIEAIERIMATRPTPIIVYSAFVDGDDRDNAAAALAAGAVDVVEKPTGGKPGELETYAEELRRRLRIAGRVKVITHPRGRLGGGAATLTTRRLGGPGSEPVADRPVRTPAVRQLRARRVSVIAIGASTGGPQALSQLLAELPADLEAAVVVVQHMAEGFIEGLANWLDGICALPVVVGASGRRLKPGTVTVAPSGLNLVVHDQLRVTTHEPPSTQYHVPGIDETFASVAEHYGADAIGVLLTGMGRDGALGLKRMRDRGSLTIGQDEETSAVYGMPAAAAALGAVELQLPLPDIGPALRQAAGCPRPDETGGAS